VKENQGIRELSIDNFLIKLGVGWLRERVLEKRVITQGTIWNDNQETSTILAGKWLWNNFKRRNVSNLKLINLWKPFKLQGWRELDGRN